MGRVIALDLRLWFSNPNMFEDDEIVQSLAPTNGHFWPKADGCFDIGERPLLMKVDTQNWRFRISSGERLLYPQKQPFRC